VLETVGREWLLERVNGVRAMSNRYSIDHAVERTSAGIPALIQSLGSQGQPKHGYAELLADPHRNAGHAALRRVCSTSLLKSGEGRLTVADTMNILRDHGCSGGPSPDWNQECPMQRTVCMHAGSDPTHGQTVGSMVSELHGNSAVHWVTGTAAPCISVFKPVLMDVPLPAHGRHLSDRFDASTLWWRHEVLHRSALRGDFGKFLQSIRPERDALESEFRARIDAVAATGSAVERARVVAKCWQDAIALERAWEGRLVTATPGGDTAYLSCWQGMNQRAGLSEAGA
jgi:secernin